MTRQMSAERTRRAVVTESEGQKQSAITVAEGQKQAAVLAAEGQQQATILLAEGERQAARLKATGLSEALDAMIASASRADGNTLTLQYLDTLRQLSQSPSTKFVLPVELTNLLAGISKASSEAMIRKAAPSASSVNRNGG